MITKISPHVCLSNVIDYYWIEKNGATSVKILPDGTTSILFNLGEKLSISTDIINDEKHVKDLIIGAHKKHYTLHESNDTHIVGIKFKQGGAFHFFNINMDEFSHKIINLHDVLNGESEQLRNLLFEGQTPEEVKRILDHYMIIKVGHTNKSSKMVDSLINKFTPNDSYNKIKDLSQTANISHKHLITIFNQIVGLTPKLVYRINKFNKVLDIIQIKNKVNWPEIAYECQYYDQAHLINDFKNFSGISPKTYFDNKNAVGLRVVVS
jgi:AraC-like DNA-binding protein